MLTEVDLRLSLPVDGLYFNRLLVLTHRYVIVSTDSTDRAYAVTWIEKKTLRVGDFIQKLFF